MIRQLYSSLHVNGDDNVAHYGNDDVNYGDNDDNDNGAEAQKPTIRTIPDSSKLLGNHLENPDSLEIIRKIGNYPEKSGQLSRFSFCTRKKFPDVLKLSGIFHICNDDAEDDDGDDCDDDGDDDDAHSEVITGQFSRSQCWKSTQCTTGSTCFFHSNQILFAILK